MYSTLKVVGPEYAPETIATYPGALRGTDYAIEELESYADPTAEPKLPSAEKLAFMSDDALFSEAADYLFKTGHNRHDGAIKQVRENGGVAHSAPYFRDLFGIETKTSDRMLSLAVGSAALGIDVFRDAALQRYIESRGGFSEVVESEITGAAYEMQAEESYVHGGHEGMIKAMRQARKDSGEAYERATRAAMDSSKRIRNIKNLTQVVLNRFLPLTAGPEEPPVVWRPGGSLV